MGISFPEFVHRNPPDNFFGVLGTSSNKIRQMLRNNGHLGESGVGGVSLRSTLRDRPAIVCIDVNKIDPEKTGLHWICVFGYGDNDYYVSNWRGRRIPRPQFKAAWTAPLVWTLGLSRVFYRV